MLAIMVIIAIISVVVVRRQSNRGQAFDSEWGAQDDVENHSIEDLFELSEEHDALDAPSDESLPEYIPEGWTLEQYHLWLEGPCPEGWAEEQWVTYVEQHTQALAEHNASSQD
jgi:hypothetical protein